MSATASTTTAQVVPPSTATGVNGASEGDKAGQGINGNTGRLGDWLLSQKELFLDDLKAGKAKGWTIAMGNEAGDLDTIASSVAFSFLSSTLRANRVIPLILTQSSFMRLRPENLRALELSHIPTTNLLYAESLPVDAANLASGGAQFAIVDHNRLLPQFGAGTVEAVIDHHDDEGYHQDADIRLIKNPTGSCASLVTEEFSKEWDAANSGPSGLNGSPVPPELATLLLSAILIDTSGLKPDRKATPTDYLAAQFLYPVSTWGAGQDVMNIQTLDGQTPVPDPLKIAAKELSRIKDDISTLSSHDLLMRDYKRYTLPTSSKVYPNFQVGLSTVPESLENWITTKSGGEWKGLLKDIDAYMVESNLDIHGVLTTFKSPKGKHKRELVLIVRIGGVIPDEPSGEKIMRELAVGLEAAPELTLREWGVKGLNKIFKRKKREFLDGKNRFGRVWKQNPSATRKQVQPVLRDLIAQLT